MLTKEQVLNICRRIELGKATEEEICALRDTALRNISAPVEAAGVPEEPFWWWASGAVAMHDMGRDYQVVLKSDYDKFRSALRGSYEECARIAEQHRLIPAGDHYAPGNGDEIAKAIRDAAQRERGK